MSTTPTRLREVRLHQSSPEIEELFEQHTLLGGRAERLRAEAEKAEQARRAIVLTLRQQRVQNAEIARRLGIHPTAVSRLVSQAVTEQSEAQMVLPFAAAQ